MLQHKRDNEPAASGRIGDDRVPAHDEGIDLSALSIPDMPAVNSVQTKPDTYYCLWQHIADQVPDLGEKMLAACEGRKIHTIQIYKELVGGAPKERAELEAFSNRYVNSGLGIGLGVMRWVIEGGVRVAGALLGGEYAARADKELCDLREMAIFRKLHKATGADVQIHLIDLHQFHPDYWSVRNATREMAAFLDGLDGKLGYARLLAGGKERLPERILGQLRSYLEEFGNMVSVRDRTLSSQLSSLAEPAPEGELRFVITGAGHLSIARGAIARGQGRILSAFGAEAQSVMPAYFDKSYNYNLSTMKTQKVAGGLQLTDRDLKDTLVYYQLKEAIGAEIWQRGRPRSRERYMQDVELVSYLATDILLNASVADRESMFESCRCALVNATDEDESVVRVMARPMMDRIARQRDGEDQFQLSSFGRRLQALAFDSRA